MAAERFDFESDNTAGLCPEAWTALENATHGSCASYGEDEWTERLCGRVREIFEIDCDIFLVFNGTAANALALAHLGRSFTSVLCHEHAHVENDESGACEFFSGGAKLIPTPGANGKLDLAHLSAALKRQHELHSHKPGAITLTQATELGTVYRPEEISEIAEFAKKRQMFLHMDGARFANALGTLGCDPADLTWRAGVDVLSLGGTKNGLAAGELVIFFDRSRSVHFDYRAKQAGQLASKMRFFAAPWLGLLQQDAWRKNAARANEQASILGDALRKEGAKIVFPVEANAVFLQMNDEVTSALRARGWHFYKFIEPDIYRLMCAWNIERKTIEDFVGDFRAVNICAWDTV